MRGDLVLVRCFEDTPAFMRVWEDCDSVVSVLSPGDFDMKISGLGNCLPVGFRFSEVFVAPTDMDCAVQWQAQIPYTGG
jgi:hypothetical protein